MAVNEPNNLLIIPNGIDTPNNNSIGRASKLYVDTTNLDGNLSGVDNDAQSIIEAIDNFTLGGGSTTVEDNLDSTSATNALSANQGNVLNVRVQTLENTAFNSGRSFVRFNDGFTIDRNNIAQFEDKNIIYTAKNDKAIDNPTAPNVVLPNDTEIQAAVPSETYPITFEFTHLGGSDRFDDPTINRVRFIIDGTVQSETLQRDEVAIVTKPAVGQPYEITVGGFDPNDTILPTGVFNLKTDTPINDISTIATELAGVTIVAGDAYLIETGGTWSGLTIPNNSILVAVVSGASLTDSPTNDDWLLLDNPRVNAKSAAFLANWEQDGIRFNGNRNVQVDPANVVEFSAMATGTPQTRRILTNSQGFNRILRYDNVPIQFSDLTGGKLQMLFRVSTTSSSGFPIEPLNMTLHYSDAIQFTFPLNNFQIDSGDVLLEIDIPNIDYSSILNTDVSLRLEYNFRGAVYDGNMIVSAVMNMATGRLHDSIVNIADQRASLVRAELNTRIDNVIGEVDDENRSLEAIQDRISPYKNISLTTPNVNALFLDSTGSDNFPSDLSTMSPVSASNPRFTGGDVALYVAVIPNGNHVLNNITQSSVLALDDSEATVDLGESLTFNNQVYFVFRVTSLTSGDVYEVEDVTTEQVVAWADDITNLEDDVERIDAELEHALLHLTDKVIQVFENEVSVIEESNPTVVATTYNNQLAGSSNTTQTVFYEQSPIAPSGGTKNSKPISDTTGDRARRKLIYFPDNTTYANQAYLVAFDGATGRDLIRYTNGTFNAQVFVPAIPSGTATSTIYPAPSNRVSGAGIWINIPALTFQNGIPVPEADEVFFTRNVPATSVPITVQYRGHANGNIFGASSITLPANQNSITFVLDDGGEQATVEVLRRSGEIRVSVTERVNAGLPTINDVEVILSYTETRTVPSTPATTREVAIESVHTGDQVFAIKPSSTGNLILVGDRTEIDTGYAYTTIFGASENGHLIATSEGATFLDYEDFNPIATTVTDLENHATLPQFGLFTTQYSHETIVNFDTQLTFKNSFNDTIDLSNGLILPSVNGLKRFSVKVKDDGSGLDINEIT